MAAVPAPGDTVQGDTSLETYSVSLDRIINEMQLRVLSGGELTAGVNITTPDLNRPGLEITGYTEDFTHDRVQLMGNSEMLYLRGLEPEVRGGRLEKLFAMGFPCLIIARALEPFPEMLALSAKYGIPVLGADIATTALYSELNRYLCVQLAPRAMIHAGLVEVYGEGVLIEGKSGVGKSETMLELIKRGHRLVADDLVEIRRVSHKTLVGSAPDIIRHLIEIRGVGFVDVKRLYGIGAVKMTENIQLVIQLEKWVEGKEYERVGMEDTFTDILGIKVPCVTIPVMPGRNLAVIVEAATMNNRQKMMGYNAAKELNKRVFENGGMPEGGSGFSPYY
ncbi:MAG: HPr(Ser) kinase/phosphatase [Clostridia bacterium]|nr:HPr(Ser) kinase/phosphatase [Clostridia bacterium]